MPRRPIHLRDALILIAATAIGLAVVRAWHDPFWDASYRLVESGSLEVLALETARWIVVALPLAWTWTVALLIIGLQGPRAGLRSRIILPGSAACGAVAVALVIDAMNASSMLFAFTLQKGITHYHPIEYIIYNLFIELDTPGFSSPGFAVTAAWATLVVSGRWQPDPSWIDRTGRLMGLVWIGLMFLRPWILTILWGTWDF